MFIVVVVVDFCLLSGVLVRSIGMFKIWEFMIEYRNHSHSTALIAILQFHVVDIRIELSIQFFGRDWFGICTISASFTTAAAASTTTTAAAATTTLSLAHYSK